MSDAVTKQVLRDELDALTVKLFKYFDKRFDHMEKRFDNLQDKFHDLQSTVDAYAKQVEIYHQESIARDAHVDRLQRWIEQVAKKTGVKLEY
jgi:Skp family chaperone for outer membrane proteins